MIRAENIDQLLGASSERYFGSGYRTVEQNIHDLVIREDIGHGSSINALIDIRSRTDGELQRKFASHLSSIDAIVISTSLAKALIAHATLDANCARRAILENVSLRAGTKADTKMSEIHARIVLSKYEYHSGMGRGKFNVTVGSMTVVISVSWEGQPWRSIKETTIVHVAAIADLLGDLQLHPRCVIPQASSLAMRNVEVDLEAKRASCEVSLERSLADLFDNLSTPIVEGLVVTSQLAQVLLFAIVGISRRAAGNLWMRRAVFSTDSTGMFLSSTFDVALTVSHSTFIEHGSRAWLTADVVITHFPGLCGKASLAFAVPT